MKRVFWKLLFAELVVIVTAISMFRFVSDKLLAGALAGAVFVALGLWIFIYGLRNSWFRKTPTFWMGCVHLFVSSLPLMITRLLNQTGSFENVLVLGLPGPVFHQLSTAIYFAMLIATIFDGLRFWKVRAVNVRQAPK